MPELLDPATLTVVCINVLLALSFWLPLSGGQLSLISAGGAAVGAYAVAWLLLRGWSFIPALVVATAAAGLVLLVIGSLSLRLRGYSYALATLGLSEGIRISITNMDSLGGPGGISVPVTASILPIAGACCAISIGLLYWVHRNRYGRHLDVLKNDQLQASALGISITFVKLSAIGGQGCLAGMAGGLMAGYAGYISPDQFGLNLLTDAFAYVVAGGLATLWGPIFGAVFLTFALQYFAAAGSYRALAFGALIVCLILLRKDGVFGRSQRLRSLRLKRQLARGADAATRDSSPPALGVLNSRR